MAKKFISSELYSSEEELNNREEFVKHFHGCPIPDCDLLQNLGLFLTSKNLSRILFMDHIYRKNLEVQGIVIEFGTRWGQNLALFSALRGIYEPFNRYRKVVGFDTFTGFPGLTDKDNENSVMHENGLACTDGYEKYLKDTMSFIEKDNPMSHVKKFDIRKGDAVEEIHRYFDEFPETIVSLAYFDLDIYEPTKECLEAIKTHLVKGSILGFDELNDHDSPGETRSLNEVLGLNNVRVKRLPYVSRASYLEFGE